MSAVYLDQITPVWNNFSKFVHVLHNEHDYEQAQINSHINENGILSVKLPKEWAEKDVNAVLVLELLNQLQESTPQKQSLSTAFDLLAQMPEDFMTHRQDDLPQERDEWL
jgi:hypothetical protein